MFAVAAVKRGLVFDGALAGAAGQEIFGHFAFDYAEFHVLDFIPLRAGEADAGEAFAACEDDASAAVIPGVVFVLAQNGELDAVDDAEFLQREAEALGDEDIDFHESLTAGVIRAQSALALPLGRQPGEKAVVQPRVGFGPTLLDKALSPTFGPQLRVGRSEAVQRQDTNNG